MAAASWTLAAFALLIQAWPHFESVVANQYPKGAAWEPRVAAILEVSRVASSGGPFLAIPRGSSFEPVDLTVNDLGFSAFGYFWGRLTGSPADRRVLMALNLALLLAALVALFKLSPPEARLALAAVLLFVPVPVPEYRSPDPLATHGTLLLMGVTLAASVTRAWPLWTHALLGAVLFGMHAIRSAYAFYATAALLAVVAFEFLRTRERAVFRRGGALLASAFVLGLLWQIPLDRRANDPRIVQQDALGTHPVYIPLLEGIGWSTNRWGIKPWDPWVSSYLAERFKAEAVNVGTKESERRARITYGELWREAPLHLLGVYAKRVPGAVSDHFALGLIGGLGLLLVLPPALSVCWRRPSHWNGLLVGSAALTACVLFQTVVLDPRLLYAYPLRLASALTFALGVGVLLNSRRTEALSVADPRTSTSS